MFSRIAILLVAATFSMAAPACSGGHVACCNTVQGRRGLADTAVQGIAAPVGVTCSPVNVLIGLGGNGCSGQVSCCGDLQSGSGLLSGQLVGFNCVPIGANL